jgi:hypothetical protein
MEESAGWGAKKAEDEEKPGKKVVLQKRWCYGKLCFYSRTLKEFPS